MQESHPPRPTPDPSGPDPRDRDPSGRDEPRFAPGEPPIRVEPAAEGRAAAFDATPSAAGPAERPAAGPAAAPERSWERALLEELARDALVERRRARRWRIGFRLAGFAAALAVAAVGLGWFAGAGKATGVRHTAVIEINGVIQSGGEVDATAVVESLQHAFKDRDTAGVVLRINSPGGSPVQAGIIHDEIRRLRKLHPSIPIYSVVEEMCASGGYYLAAATDRIFVDKASIVGSIGVLMDGFGFTGLMEKVGVERRLLTAGANKGFLDSFSPVSPQHQAHAQQMLDEIHQQFIKIVKDGRGARLKDSAELFSGLFWTGQRSVELGLADDFGTVEGVARDVVKAEEVVDFTRRDSVVDRIARRVGAAAGASIAAQLRLPAELRLR